MPRKKKMASKAAPKKMQKQTQSVGQLEKNFKSMPSQIVAHCRNELSTLKQHTKELSTAAKSAEALATAIKKKCDALTQSKPTKTTKKQLASAKLGYAKAMQAVKAMSKELNAIEKDTSALALTSAKYTAFAKEWAMIEKQLAKKTKAIKAPQKTKAILKKSKKSKAPVAIETKNAQDETLNTSSQAVNEDTQSVETV